MQLEDKHVTSEGQQQYLCCLASVVGFCEEYMHQAHVMECFPVMLPSTVSVQ